MATQAFGPIRFPDPRQWANNYASLAMTASGYRQANHITIPRTGTIDRVVIRTGAVSNSQTLRVGIYTQDGSYNATSTEYGSSGYGTQASPAANTGYEVTLGTACSGATAGDDVCVVTEWDGTAGNVNIAHSNSGVASNYPFVSLYNGTSWTRTAALPVCGLRYNDGTYAWIGCSPFTTVNSVAYNSGTNPNERMLLFTPLVPLRMIGMGCQCNLAGTSSDFDLILYDGSMSAVKTAHFYGAQPASTGSQRSFEKWFTSTTLSAGTTYRISLKPTTANNVTLNDFQILSAGMMDGFEGGTQAYLSTRNAGVNTDTNTRRPAIYAIFDGASDGVGGGGGGRILGSSIIQGVA